MAHPSVFLRPTQPADLDFLLAAEQNSENAPFIMQWVRDRHLQACTSANERHWIITEAATQAPVGYTILSGAEDFQQNLLIKRIVITHKGRGFGRVALIEVLKVAFLELNAHRVWLDVVEQNERARSLYQSLGFVEEGILREAYRTQEGFLSMRLMAMLRAEFLANTNSPSIESVGVIGSQSHAKGRELIGVFH